MARKQPWPLANRPEETWVPGPALPSLTSWLVFHSFPGSAKGELKHMVHEFSYSSNCPRSSLLILSKQPERPLVSTGWNPAGRRQRDTWMIWAAVAWKNQEGDGQERLWWHAIATFTVMGQLWLCSSWQQEISAMGEGKRTILHYQSPTSSHSKLWNSRLDNTKQGEIWHADL